MAFSNLDARRLAEKLSRHISGEVRFDEGSRALYSQDASNYRQIPIGVVIPKNQYDILETIEICRHFEAPILSRGAGTSIAGQSVNTAVVLDYSKYYNSLLELDENKKIARVHPGIILDHLNQTASKHNLLFGPDPATHNRCTIGGMIGNNSCGVHSVRWGKTVDNILELDVLTYEGKRLRVSKTPYEKLIQFKSPQEKNSQIYKDLDDLQKKYADLIRTRFPKIPRRVSGYNLDQLLPENGFDVARSLVGTEGTCVIILEATLKLVPLRRFKSLAVLSYKDLFNLADHIPTVLGFSPSGVEGINDRYVENMKIRGMHAEEMKLLPPGKAWLLVEFDGETRFEMDGKSQMFLEAMKKDKAPLEVRIFHRDTDIKAIWSIRESSFGASMFVPGRKDTYSGWEDAAVPPDKLGFYFRKLQDILDKYAYEAISYGHFGDGCVHSRIDFDLKTQPGVQQYRAFVEEAADLVVACGGSFSGEHGDGQATAELLPKLFGPELVEAFEKFKAIWDPQNKMNPGKVVRPYPLDSNLRTLAYTPIPTPKLHFQFKEDHGDFNQSVSRCIGIGKCRKEMSGTMCPSYLGTRDENLSTRGRAHLLQEMMRGEILKDNWKSPAIKESLDSCLSCKACKSECPTNVDIATYKAEFFSHYYQNKLRPISHYVFGHIHIWAKLGSYFPSLANGLLHHRFFRDKVRNLLELSRHRHIPSLTSQSFRKWFKKTKRQKNRTKKVMLWPDTFTNFFYPDIGKSAVAVLEKLGCEVVIPKQDLCCGRSFYDFGMLNEAKSALIKIMTSLEYELSQGTALVGLEPSCISVFKDELLNLFPDHPTAKRLAAQSFHFAEFIETHLNTSDIIKIKEKNVLLQVHCHQQALVGSEKDKALLLKLGFNVTVLDAGCCGMAGPFGFTHTHEHLAKVIGEARVLPEIRKAEHDTFICADGFSCREQVRQGANRQPLHLAQILEFALKEQIS